MHKRIILCLFSLLGFCACVDTQRIAEDDSIGDSYLHYVRNNYRADSPRYQSNREYYIDGLSVDSIRMDTMVLSDSIYHVYKDYVFPEISRAVKDSIKKAQGVTYLKDHVTYFTHAYTPQYMKDHSIEPSLFELSVDHNSVMFLNLISDKVGKMNAVSYDINTGERISTYVSGDYDGGFYLGLRVDTNKISRLRCIATIDGYHVEKEFDYQSIIN